MSFQPLLACGPGAEVIYGALGILGAGALSFLAGFFYLCTGHATRGAWLMAVPVCVIGGFILWAQLL